MASESQQHATLYATIGYIELEATIVEKYAAVEAFLDERGRRIWEATESRAIGYGGDALVSDATGLSRPTIRKGRSELESGGAAHTRHSRAHILTASTTIVPEKGNLTTTAGFPDCSVIPASPSTKQCGQITWGSHEIKRETTPLSKTGAELLFELVSQRYERAAVLITSNLPFDEWTETFGTERLTGALLDRLTHHVHILEMNGQSFRLNHSRARNKGSTT